LQAEPRRIVIRSVKRPRTGWADAARLMMRDRNEDGLIDESTPTRFDREEWKWR
jgi:antitoxin MazE